MLGYYLELARVTQSGFLILSLSFLCWPSPLEKVAVRVPTTSGIGGGTNMVAIVLGKFV